MTEEMYNDLNDKYLELIKFVTDHSNEFTKETQLEYSNLLLKHIS